jgi:hypothetical protein
MLRVIFFLLPFQIYAVNYKYCNQFIAENVGPVFKKDLVFNDDGKVNNPGDFGSFNEKEKIKTYGAFTKGRDYKVYYNDNDRPYLVEYKFNGSSHLLELTTQNNVCRVTNYIESIDRDKAGFIYSESACFEAYLFKHNSEKINSLTYE